MKNTTKTILLASLLFLAGFLAGCAQQPTVSAQKIEDNRLEYKRLGTIGIASNLLMYENETERCYIATHGAMDPSIDALSCVKK